MEKALRLRAPVRGLALNSRSIFRLFNPRKNLAVRAIKMKAIARTAYFTNSDEIHSAEPTENAYVSGLLVHSATAANA